MKTIKVRTKNNFVNIKGMALLEFIIVIMAVFVVVAIFIEIGYYLKSEAVVVAYTKIATKNVAATGSMTENYAKDLANKLNKEGIRNVEIRVFDMDVANPTLHPIIDYYKTDDDENYINTIGTTMGFRRDFKLVIKGEHPLKEVSFKGTTTVDVPVVYGENAKVEAFKPSDN